MSVAEYNLHVLPQGHTLRVRANQTLLDAANRAGLNLTYSCRMGYCGSCRARLLSGSIEYPSGRVISPPFTAVEDGEIMLCIARARSDLQIEPLFSN